jgi:hypothetical protein
VLKVKLHGTETTAYQFQQIITSQRKAIRDGDIERAELKALHISDASEITYLKLRVDTLLSNVSNNAQIAVVHDTITKEAKNALLLPFNFSRVDKWLNLNGMFNNVGKLDIDLNLSFDVDIYSGISKITKKRTAVITTDCSYIKVIGIKSFKFDEQKPKKWGVGVQAGYGVLLSNPVKMSPYVGIGVSRNIIVF